MNRKRNRLARSACFVAIAFVVCIHAAAGDEPSKLEFNRDVRPILSDKCFLCHGPDKNQRKAGLRLDVRDEALAERHGKHAIVPGDRDASEVVARILNADPDEMMPPPESERSLTEEQKDILVRWIEAGAEYEPYWAFIPPVRHGPPSVEDSTWVKNEIDAFVLAPLEARGISPSREADRRTLIRRLSFDLTGLPPTPEEVEAFENDPRHQAYEEMVDRLLVSPHFGERMAMYWLDLVRYADTNGYHGDEYRSIWPYRDYVIEAFNDNMPFDEFTIEQLAGDLLPDATRQQKIASGYNRLNQITAEGGAQPKEYVAMYAADRVRTTATVWMGATMGCAQCHDHKFDPYTTKDFYQFSAFFADVEEKGVYSAGDNWAPFMSLPTPEQSDKVARINRELDALRAEYDADTDALRDAQSSWEARLRDEIAQGNADWKVVTPTRLATDNGTDLARQDDGAILATGPNPDHDNYTAELRPGVGRVTGVFLETLMHPSLPNGLSRGNGNFVLTDFSVEVRRADGAVMPAEISDTAASYEQGADFPVRAAIDDDPASGWAVDGYKKDGNRYAVFTFREPFYVGPEDTVVVHMKHESSHAGHNIGCFRLSLASVDAPQLPVAMGLPSDIREVLELASEKRSDEQAGKLRAYYRSVAPELASVRQSIADHEAERKTLEAEIPTTLITVSVEPRTTRVLPRGNWMDDSGEIVEPAVPAFLPQIDTNGQRATRLDLAKWLVEDDNPLTARAFVNRIWKLMFGTGISKVLDDLGSQGEWPTHPELLDWLAVEFRESGWDVKHIVKTIVMSSTYRQSTETTPKIRHMDPYNRLLAHQSRFRLNAEMIRDNALAVSGLLSDTVGGPSVYPYQPDGYWDNCNTFTGRLIYTTSEGENQHRRGLYTIWKRSFLHPSILAFDAPTREECTAERTVSNTPLQALVLLNDPTYVEAARLFAEHILSEGGKSPSERLQWAFRRVLNREATPDEVRLLAEMCGKHYGEYANDPEAAQKLLQLGQAPLPQGVSAPELAAWTSVARVILNLHEVITRT